MFADTKYAKKNLPPGAPRVSPERKVWVKRESAALFARNLLSRDKTKEKMFEDRTQQLVVKAIEREKRQDKWLKKTKTSPFAVDLVAEDERIYEENQIRMKEEADRRKRVEERRAKAKNDLILQALSEFSDLEALRREKRAIIEEEQRLRALLSLEKVTQNQKGERLGLGVVVADLGTAQLGRPAPGQRHHRPLGPAAQCPAGSPRRSPGSSASPGSHQR
jgi:hypothetical protein